MSSKPFKQWLTEQMPVMPINSNEAQAFHEHFAPSLVRSLITDDAVLDLFADGCVLVERVDSGEFCLSHVHYLAQTDMPDLDGVTA